MHGRLSSTSKISRIIRGSSMLPPLRSRSASEAVQGAGQPGQVRDARVASESFLRQRRECRRPGMPRQAEDGLPPVVGRRDKLSPDSHSSPPALASGVHRRRADCRGVQAQSRRACRGGIQSIPDCLHAAGSDHRDNVGPLDFSRFAHVDSQLFDLGRQNPRFRARQLDQETRGIGINWVSWRVRAS